MHQNRFVVFVLYCGGNWNKYQAFDWIFLERECSVPYGIQRNYM